MKKITIQERFEKFHSDHPHVYEILVKFAKEAKKSGKTKLGTKLLVERARWELMFLTKSEDSFKINNSYTSRYARLIMEQEGELEDFFNLRNIKTI